MAPRTPSTARRRAFAIALLVAAGVLLVLAAGAFANVATPESGGSPNADRINSLYKIVLAVAIVVFVGVEGTLLYSVIRFRARPGRVAAQIRGNTNLEIGWTVGAALVLVVLAIFTFAKLEGIKNPDRSSANGLTAGGMLYATVDQPSPPGGKRLNIEVEGRQYIWRYVYPNDAFSYEEMVVPVDTTVTLDIKSTDVAHSWWIPKLGGKMDAIPGYTNHTWFKISKPGVYEGQCAELCGRNHANMTARVRAVPVAEYEAWVERQARDIQEANRLVQRQRATQELTTG